MLRIKEDQARALASIVESGCADSVEAALEAAIGRYCEDMKAPQLSAEEDSPEFLAELERRCETLDRGEGLSFDSIEELDTHLRSKLKERAAARKQEGAGV